MKSTPDFASKLAKREPVADSEPEIKEPASREQKRVPGRRKSESREGMKLISSWVSMEIWERYRILATKERTTMDALQAEAHEAFIAKRWR